MKKRNIIILSFIALNLNLQTAHAFSWGKLFKRESVNESPVQPPSSDQTQSTPTLPVSSTPTVVTPTPTPSPTPTPTPISGYAEGDIIFIQSQTQQSAALREATESVWTHVGLLIKKSGAWYVSEAIGPVVSTKIADFIARSKNKAYRIYRFKHFDPATMQAAMYSAISRYNKPYDIYFEFSNDKIYCSELTYKVMKDVTGFDLGRIQKMKEMKLDGPYAQALIKKRLTDTGRELNPEELIITPVSQMMDENITLVESKNN
jgi:cell wall-associated NlpC family hydrolase